jgi:hypothetical protein
LWHPFVRVPSLPGFIPLAARRATAQQQYERYCIFFFPIFGVLLLKMADVYMAYFDRLEVYYNIHSTQPKRCTRMLLARSCCLYPCP